MSQIQRTKFLSHFEKKVQFFESFWEKVQFFESFSRKVFNSFESYEKVQKAWILGVSHIGKKGSILRFFEKKKKSSILRVICSKKKEDHCFLSQIFKKKISLSHDQKWSHFLWLMMKRRVQFLWVIFFETGS